MLLHRRIFRPRIRLTSHRTDLAILIILWIQLVLGLVTLPYSSWGHRDGGRPCSCLWLPAGHRHLCARRGLLTGIGWPFLVHMLLGMTIFLLFPLQPPGACERLRHAGLPWRGAAGDCAAA